MTAGRYMFRIERDSALIDVIYQIVLLDSLIVSGSSLREFRGAVLGSLYKPCFSM